MNRSSTEKRSQSVTSSQQSDLLNSFRFFAKEIKRYQDQAKAQGLFAHDRGLLDCTRCGLTEDVQPDNRLTTFWRHGDVTHDTGLRFKELPNGQWQCPHCQAIVCFDSHFDTTTLEWLRQQKNQCVSVLEAALDTTGKWNLHHQLGDS